MDRSDESLYVKPVRGIEKDDCFFYHQMDLPGVGSVGTQWDIQSECDAYLGGVDFAGKRVLDVGAASGFLTFEMEKRGAEVVSFDMVDASHWDIVPRAKHEPQSDEVMKAKHIVHKRLRNAYWFAHEKLNSNAKVYLGDVYDLPLELGQFDIVFFGMILGHLQNPFKAMHTASRLCREQIVIANQTVPPLKKWGGKKKPFAYFMPTADNDAVDCWWAMSDECIANMLDVLGFSVEQQNQSNPKCIVEGRVGTETCTTTVSNRVVGQPVAGLSKVA